MRLNILFLALILYIAQLLAQDAQTETPQLSVDELLSEGDKHLKNNEIEQSIKQYTKAIELDEENYLSYYKRAAVYLLKGRHQNALTDLNKVLQRKPDFIQAKIRRGKLLVSFGRFGAAKQDFEEVLKEKPDQDVAVTQLSQIIEGERLLSLANKALENKQYGEAKTYFTDLIDVSPDSIEARLARATCNLNLKEYNVVIEDTMRVLKSQAENLEALFLRGRAFYLLGQNEAAINHFSQALKYDPDNTKCRTEFKKIKKVEKTIQNGDQLLSQGRPQEALEEFTAVLEIEPDHPLLLPRLYLSKCKCFVQLKKGKEAIEQCTKSIEYEDSLDAYVNRAEGHLILDEFDAAINDFQKAREKDPNSRQVHEGLNKAQRLQKMAKRKDYYKILGIGKDAPNSEIRRVYRRLALEYHPDKHDDDKEAAEKMFIEISEAYEVLSDEEKRRRYDNGEDIEVPQFHNPFQGGPFNFQFNMNNFGFGRR